MLAIAGVGLVITLASTVVRTEMGSGAGGRANAVDIVRMVGILITFVASVLAARERRGGSDF
jgi:hypothetical protein